jgi:hypothetical protein
MSKSALSAVASFPTEGPVLLRRAGSYRCHGPDPYKCAMTSSLRRRINASSTPPIALNRNCVTPQFCTRRFSSLMRSWGVPTARFEIFTNEASLFWIAEPSESFSYFTLSRIYLNSFILPFLLAQFSLYVSPFTSRIEVYSVQFKNRLKGAA